MKTQPSVVVLGYFHLHPQNKVFCNEYNGRQKTLCCFHSEGKKDQYGTGYKRLGRILAGDCFRHVKTYAGTWTDTTDACRENKLCISKVLKGQENMSLETICKIEHALGVEIIKRLNENEQ